MRASDENFKYKIVLVGDSSVGKSSLIKRFALQEFPEVLNSTIGVDFVVKNLTIDGYTVKMQIWDTAGQERFRTIITGYYRGADAVIFVFDKTVRATFEHIDDWIEEVNKYSSDKAMKIIVGNKSDMEAQVSLTEAQEKACSLGFKYIDASAKSDVNVDCIFTSIASELVKRSKSLGIISYNPEKILLHPESDRKKAWCC